MCAALTRSRTAWQRALLGVAIAVGLSACVVYERPAPSYYGVAVAVAPPPPQVVDVPPPQAGFTWSPGYWNWNGQQYVWVGGSWVAQRPGYRWVSAHWVGINGGWRFVRGHWEPS
jgi:hypothetical protein